MFIINTLTKYSEPPRSRHQVAQSLTEYGKVYFIAANEIGMPGFNEKKIDGINFIIPKWPIDYRIRYRTPLLNEYYQKFIFSELKKKSLNKELLINFDHSSSWLHSKFENSVYYCSDDHIGNSSLGLGFVNRYHKNSEKKIASESNLCICTSAYLKKKLELLNKNTYQLELGAPDLKDFNIRFKKSKPGEKIKVGYVGFLVERKTDDNIIQNIIDDDNLELHVIGTVDTKYKSMLSGKAVLAGIKKHIDLYSYLENMDVCIIPYDVNGINKGVTPNKYWLYTSLGKPVISVAFDNILDWSTENSLLYFANKEIFNQTIKTAYLENDEEKFLHRLNHAKENTWNKRIEKFITLVNEHV
jgi:hypothetical protein